MVSEKVAMSLAYQAAWRIAIGCCSSRYFAASVTIEYSARIAGVVRAMAGADHCRCVSMPRWARASSNVTSICHRRTNQARICSGSAASSVHRNACGLNVFCGSRTRSQRNGTTGRPLLYQTALPVAISTALPPWPYQCDSVTLRQPRRTRVSRRSPRRYAAQPCCAGQNVLAHFPREEITLRFSTAVAKRRQAESVNGDIAWPMRRNTAVRLTSGSSVSRFLHGKTMSPKRGMVSKGASTSAA